MSNGKTEEQQQKRNEIRKKESMNTEKKCVCVCVWQKVSVVYQLLKRQILEKAAELFIQLQQSQQRNG